MKQFGNFLFANGLLALSLVLLLGACESTPQLGSKSPFPIASEAPASDDPPCLQTLQCIIDNTTNNTLRKQTQEVVNTLFTTAEPDYTRICQTRSAELAERVPECQKK